MLCITSLFIPVSGAQTRCQHSSATLFFCHQQLLRDRADKSSSQKRGDTLNHLLPHITGLCLAAPHTPAPHPQHQAAPQPSHPSLLHLTLAPAHLKATTRHCLPPLPPVEGPFQGHLPQRRIFLKASFLFFHYFMCIHIFYICIFLYIHSLITQRRREREAVTIPEGDGCGGRTTSGPRLAPWVWPRRQKGRSASLPFCGESGASVVVSVFFSLFQRSCCNVLCPCSYCPLPLSAPAGWTGERTLFSL